AWIVAYGGAQLLPTGPALALASAAAAVATVLSRIAGRRARAAAVSGWETKFWRGWLVLAGGSLLLDLVDGAAPLPVLFLLAADHALVLFGAIGGTAMIALGLVRLRDG